MALPRPLITRFAPTPSGYLHLGNVYSLVLTWLIAKKSSGQILLRIDDLDKARYRPAYLQNILDTLDFLGMELDGTPASVHAFEQAYSQHLHVASYQAAIDQLAAKGLLFACACSRKEVIAQAQDGQYGGTCRDKYLPLSEGYAWRIKTAPANPVTFSELGISHAEVDLHKVMRDFVIRRKDGLPAYQVASIIDDLRLGTNLIVRGQDLWHSTAAQVFLADVLGEKAFRQIRFYHHPLVKGSGDTKLSKSQRASPVLEAFSSKEALISQLGQMILGKKISSLDELLEEFTLAHLPSISTISR